MPIIIKDYVWRQTKDTVILRVPLKGASMKNTDLFTSDKYLKIHSPPFLFEVCLWSPIVEEESTCTIDNGEAVFTLLKQKAEQWPSLAADLDREEALELKKKAIEEAQVRAQKRLEEKKAIKDQKQKAAVREQISLNTQEQKLIEKNKQEERATALKQMGWGRSQSVKIVELQDDNDKEKTVSQKKVGKEIFKAPRNTESNKLIPAPRQSAQISVSFTPREFPTPCRESKIPEEQEWLAKQADARRMTGFVAEDLRPEERDPIWLCEKAQNFYDVGNYLGAISAYSHALTLNDRLYELYAGRAKAHLALGNLNRVITDSSKALDLLTPAVPQNAEARAQCLLSRGSALASLGLHSEALGELRAAEQLAPNSTEIKEALAQLQSQA